MEPIPLTVQYCMHPGICKFPNENFYDGKLETDESVERRHSGFRFSEWIDAFTRRTNHSAVQRRCMFVDVEDGVLQQEMSGTSKVNLANACVVFRLVSSMVNEGHIPASDIMVLCYYLAQTRLLRELLKQHYPDIRTLTVDSSQGGESSVVVLDSVTPGGKEYPIGFVKDPNRLNVGLARAKDGDCSVWAERQKLPYVRDREVADRSLPRVGPKCKRVSEQTPIPSIS
ncbi:hypothetical protein GP486_005835 [Trichoglossum hirsutum]|uniref:DNA2/NAM7 helicase-like C-terminal domain-containing protein n=1 Tax=Trichoglossum hirsutum TaxID=265104 RepID=A0A9P8L8L1_9PEZI|nr:hypothetical protein GP486_005835 [Trichoglossum hirsutum]